MTTRRRRRSNVTPKDSFDGIHDNVPKGAEPGGQDDVQEEAVAQPAPEPEPAPQDEEPYVRLNGPYTADGVNVMDASGVRVAIAGYDDNRAASGPGLAHMIAKGLNKLKPQR